MKIEVSHGEIVDKATILAIKLEKIKHTAKRKNVRMESEIVHRAMEGIGIGIDSAEYQELKQINLELWSIEDEIRMKEYRQEFDEAFIALARKVYRYNDERARIKRKVNLSTGSALVEEKEYADYR
jgi:hypothetical protein